MKTTFLSLLCLLMFTTAFAGDPIPGVGVGSGKNPGGQIVSKATTDNNGRFTLTVKEAGKYDLSLSYNKVMETVYRLYKDKASNSCYKILLALDPDTLPGISLNGNTRPRPVVITAGTGNISLNVPKGGAVSFILTFEDTCKK